MEGLLKSNKLSTKLKNNKKKKLAEQAKCPLCKEKIIVKENTLASYEKPDQYEIAVGIEEAFYYRRWIKCYLCSMVFSIYSRSRNSFDYLYKELYRKVGAVPWRKLSTEETFKLVLKLSPEKSETVYRVNFIKDKIASLIKFNLYSKKKIQITRYWRSYGQFCFCI